MLPDEQFQIEMVGDIGTFYKNLYGVAEHNHYHSGQMVLLKKSSGKSNNMNEPFDITLWEKMGKEELARVVNYLIETDFHALVQVLYRIDINEVKLKQTLHDNASQNAGNLIADMIMKRQQQKAEMKKQFKQQTDIPEDEKW